MTNKRLRLVLWVLICAVLIAAAVLIITTPKEEPEEAPPWQEPIPVEGAETRVTTAACIRDLIEPVSVPERHLPPRWTPECEISLPERVRPVPTEPEPVLEYLGKFYVTGYDACVRCCGKSDGITASGELATVGHTVAMCRSYPFGTRIFIDGLGYYTVEDRGVGESCVDVFCNNHSECYALTGNYDVYIVKEG